MSLQHSRCFRSTGNLAAGNTASDKTPPFTQQQFLYITDKLLHVRVLARDKLKEGVGGGGVDRIYLLPKYFAMHIWLNISFSEQTERREEEKKGGGILKKAG